jgi:hypothetical protein
MIFRNKKWEQPVYQYFPIGIYNLHGEEPNWEDIENRGIQVAKGFWERNNPSSCQRCKTQIQ